MKSNQKNEGASRMKVERGEERVEKGNDSQRYKQMMKDKGAALKRYGLG
jgi:hypothetical protein